MSASSFLTFDHKRIAYVLSEGKSPTIIFMGGFKSDMTGTKATTLEAFAKKAGHRFIRFDYTGHGQSSGDFKQGTIGSWKQDALDVLTKLGSDKNILVGSSMGGWIGLEIAMQHKDKVAALVGISTAPDFTERLIWQQIKPEQKKQLMEEGVFHAPSCYGEDPYPITRQLIEEGRNHLLLDKPIAINAPVRLIHGTNDEDVPWQMAVELKEKLRNTDVELYLVEGGNHRLSEPNHLDLLCDTVAKLLKTL